MLPLVITNDDPNDIKSQIFDMINHPDLDTILFFAPYISSYFINIVDSSNAKQILVLTNNDPPLYTKKAMNQLFMMDATNIVNYLKLHSNIRTSQSMRKSLQINRRVFVKKINKFKSNNKKQAFVHMKLLIPYFIDRSSHKLYPKYAFSGSVNWTANGIKNNDELLIILRDRTSISKCVSVLERFWENGIDYDFFN